MSSDDYLYVGRKSNGKFTIVHFMGDGPETSQQKQEALDASLLDYSTLEEAVLRAHRHPQTEYGVQVDSTELERVLGAHYNG